MQKITCDSCGALYNIAIKDEMISCHYCGCCFFIQHDDTGFIQADRNFDFLNQQYTPITCHDYYYDGGVKKEWLVLDALQQQYILTQEDEIYSLVEKCECDMFLSLQCGSLLPNTQIDVEHTRWLVTERCTLINEHKQSFNYVYLTANDAKLLVLIFKDGAIECRKGRWLDPFEISF